MAGHAVRVGELLSVCRVAARALLALLGCGRLPRTLRHADGRESEQARCRDGRDDCAEPAHEASPRSVVHAESVTPALLTDGTRGEGSAVPGGAIVERGEDVL